MSSITVIQTLYLVFDSEAGGAMNDLVGHSITYRVVFGSGAGKPFLSTKSHLKSLGSSAASKQSALRHELEEQSTRPRAHDDFAHCMVFTNGENHEICRRHLF